MRFVSTPEEAQTTAATVASRLAETGHSVDVEVPISNGAPYRTTLRAKMGKLTLLVEAQGKPSYDASLRELALWLGSERLYCELYVAVSREEHVALDTMARLKADGVGLLLVRADGSLEHQLAPRNPALLVNVDPGLALGRCEAEIRQIVDRFNGADRKAALRDLCDVVERETRTLLVKAETKGWLVLSGAQIDAMDWSSRINVLHAGASYVIGKQPLFDAKAKDDHHSFRGARNLVDHPAITKLADLKRQRQYPERMMMGARLAADLLSLQRTVR